MKAKLPEVSQPENAEAIAASLNQALKVRGVTTKVILKGNLVKVLLESTLVPNQKLLAPFVLKSINDLQLESAETLQIYGRQKGQSAPAWTQNFTLDKVEAAASLEDDNSVAADDPAATEQNRYRELARKGDLDAIATLLNQRLGDENVTLLVERQDAVLKVVAKTDQFLEGQAFAKRVYQVLIDLELDTFEQAEVNKQKVNSSLSFQLKTFTLTKPDEPEATDPSPEETAHSIESPTTQTTTKAVRKPQNINKIRRRWTVVLISLVAGLIIFQLIRRMVWLFTTPMGGAGILIGLFFLWRAWGFLNPLLQQLLREE